jgi:hypothetical protein
MIAPRIALLVAALVLTAQADLFAQQEPPVAPGDRVRVTVPAVQPEPLVGTVVEIDRYVCFIAREGYTDPLGLPLTSIEKFEVSRGRKSNILKGAGLGVLFGFAAGAVIITAACAVDPCPWTTAEGVVGAGTIGAGLGLLIGVSAGASSSGELWEPVPLDELRVTIAPHPRGGLAVSVSVAF